MNKSPITLQIERVVSPENREEFEQCLSGLVNVMETYRGYVSHNIAYQEEDAKFDISFKFDTMNNFEHWQNSDERNRWVAKLDQLSSSHVYHITGLEQWFTLKETKKILPPPRYKMAITTWIGITSLLLVYNYFSAPYLKNYSMVVRTLLTTPVVVIIMTYLWMPFLTKILKKWLYPEC